MFGVNLKVLHGVFKYQNECYAIYLPSLEIQLKKIVKNVLYGAIG